MSFRTLCGDVIAMLKTLADNSVDAIVTDPPYHLTTGKKGGTGRARVTTGFMGMTWDGGDIAYSVPMWKECIRVLKPGGHLLSFGGSRTYHRMACAVEDAGFEIRDQIQWIFGCLDEETQLVSQDGIKHYHKAIVGEHVLCYSLENGEYSYQPILEIVEYDYSDTAYRLIGDFGEQVVSRNHRCIIERGGGEVFEFAEEIARECEACIPILESLSALQQAFSYDQPHSGITKQILQSDMLQCADRGEEQRCDADGTKKREDNHLFLRETKVDAECLAEESQDANMQQQVQRSLQGCGVEETRTQGKAKLETGIRDRVKDKDDWRNESGVERRIDVSEAQGSVCRPVNQVRSVSSGFPEHGAEGRLRDGAPSIGRADDRQGTSESGSCTSPEPSSDGEPDCEFDAIRDERRTQGVRAWRGHKTAVVRVVPFHYTGKMWCLRVSTGAFVAVRGGVAFPTGNSGFPKSMDAARAIDNYLKVQGTFGEPKSAAHAGWIDRGRMRGEEGHEGYQRPWMEDKEAVARNASIYIPGSEKAKEFSGWGTALKPAHEPIVLARKPLIGTVAANILTHGTGALNIAACRIPGEPVPINKLEAWSGFGQEKRPDYTATMSDVGRWPANLIHDGSEEVLNEFAKAGQSKSSVSEDSEEYKPNKKNKVYGNGMGGGYHPGFDDSGTAARFFYCAKADREDRNEGCEETLTWENVDLKSALMDLSELLKGISDDTMRHLEELEWSTSLFGSNTTDLFQTATMFIIKTKLKMITESTISNSSPNLITRGDILDVIKILMASGLSHAICVEKINASKLNTTNVVTESVLGVASAVLKMLFTISESVKLGNVHSTVKPTDLMRYLCKMITPPGGTILDPFMGSGSTGKAALYEGFNFIGIEKEAEYCAIAKARMEYVLATDVPLLRAMEASEQPTVVEVPQVTQEMFNF